MPEEEFHLKLFLLGFTKIEHTKHTLFVLWEYKLGDFSVLKFSPKESNKSWEGMQYHTDDEHNDAQIKEFHTLEELHDYVMTIIVEEDSNG